MRRCTHPQSCVSMSFTELACTICDIVYNDPDFVSKPRGSEVRELIVPSLTLTNPRARVLHNRRREANYGFAVGEFLWYWRGSNSLEEMKYYNKRMSAFSDDGETLNSAYGYILKGKGGDDIRRAPYPYATFIDQWHNCTETLVEDKDSRRAVMFICQPPHIDAAYLEGSNDVPCTLSLQFFIRENELYLHVNMRSNDVHWGLTYDLFSFTMLQECMLLELRYWYPDLKLGSYIHTAGSMHIYEHHYDMTYEMLDEWSDFQWKIDDWADAAKGMPPLDSLKDLEDLQVLERKLRIGDRVDGHDFSGAAGWMADRLFEQRKKRDKEKELQKTG